jgi:2-polyprenyl-3-methyl-5-hydroxy-6-metoxy-1,4-benzoquinol methylase
MVIKDQLEEIEFLLKLNRNAAAIQECCSVFEVILKKVYGQALVELPYAEREKLYQAERKIGGGTKGYTEFGFGQLVGLFSECNLLASWAKVTGKELGLIKSISLNPIVDLRNRIVHNNAVAISRDQAQLVYACLKNWLAFLGYAGIEENVAEAFQVKPVREKQEVQTQYQEHVKKRQSSTYTFSKKSEQVRLGKAVDIYREIDRRAIEFALANMEKKEGLTVLDVGCANGKILESRFANRDIYGKAVGIDYNEEVIRRKQEEDSDFYHYYCMDLEAEDLGDRLDEMMNREEIEKFDIIFSSLVIHHLKNPNRLLRILSKKLKKNGAIILRGAEDGSKLAYDDNGLVSEIIRRSAAVKGMSDRFHGRKFYSQLYRCGFRRIHMLYEERDTVGKDFDECLDMFQLSFSYRKDYFERQLAMDPENLQYQEDYRWICEALSDLEELFVMPDFYYLEMVPAAIGFK